MKQFSIITNIVLLLAVGFLYYLHFDRRDNKNKGAAATNNAASCAAKNLPVIAYVNLDSLNNNVTFIKDKRNELEAEQNKIQAEYQNKREALEARKDDFLKKGNAITQQQADEFQAELMKSAQQIEDEKQAKTQELSSKSADLMQDMQTKLKAFLDDYKEKKYTYILATGTGLDYMFYKDSTLDITQDIVKGLNTKSTATDKP